uniref:C-type lectin domain-containing protein n=1 Tax=Plectus sambesii TaxID=2011161 RepID=A0A914WTB4_9BILA
MALFYAIAISTIITNFVSSTVLSDLQADVTAKCKTFPINQMLGSSCYFTTSTTSKYTRTAAIQQCVASGGRLATPRTADVITAMSATNGIFDQLSAKGISSVHIGLYSASSSSSATSWMANASTAAELFSVRAAFAATVSGTSISQSATELCGYLNMPTETQVLWFPPTITPAKYAIDDTCNSQKGFICQIDAFGFTFNNTKSGYYYGAFNTILSSITSPYLCGVECFRWSPGCLSFAWATSNQCALYYEKYTAAQVNTTCSPSQCDYYVRYF